MKLPKSLRIGPFDYAVRMWTDEQSKSHEADGMCSETTIFIRRSLEDQRMLETLLHELLHAIHDIADLGDKSDEEEFTRRSAPLLLCVFRDNPELLSLINKYCQH